VYVKLRVACVTHSVRRACEAVSPMRYACPGLHEKSRGFGVRVTSSGIPRHGLRTGRAHVLAWGTPRNARLAWDAQGDVVAARMVGIRQEGDPCQMVPSEKGRGARSANSCHDVTGKRAQVATCHAGAQWGKKKKRREKQASPLRVYRIPWAGVEDPLALGTGRH